MRSKWIWVLALVVLVPAGRAAAQPSGKDLAGTWVVTTVSRDGRFSEDDQLVVAKLTFDGNTVTPSKTFGGFGFRGARSFKIDPATKPVMSFDIPDEAGKAPVVGICEVQNGTLKLAFRTMTDEKKPIERPVKFETKKDDGVASYVLVRESGPAAKAALNASSGRRSFHGTWIAEEAKLGGKKIPDEALKSIQFTITEDKQIEYKFGTGDKVGDKLEGKDKAEITITDSKSPTRIDFENNNKRELGIIELQQSPKDTTGRDDVLIICVDLSAIKRPGKFESLEGSDYMLIRLKRDNKPQ